MHPLSKQDRPTIILAEDDEASRALLVRQLRSAGHEVIACGDGAEALAALRAAGSGIIVADWNMPNMDGLALLQTIRRTPHLKHLPVLMITAEAKKENIIAAAQAGASGYVVKPFTAATLAEKLEKIFERMGRSPA